MQFNDKKLSTWRQAINQALPGLLSIIGTAQGRALILGASVLQIYHDQGWIARARATGDLDLSVGIVADANEYQVLRTKLIESGYRATDKERYFRLFSSLKIGLAIAYVDLLAHPEGSVPPKEARSTMGVGDGWSFNEILFALEQAHPVAKNIYVPNIIGFLAMKAASYADDPTRTKDLVDIVDVVFGLVDGGRHFELDLTWTAMSKACPAESEKVKFMVRDIAQGGIKWDFGRAEQEFLQRGYDFERLEEEGPMMFAEFLEVLV